MTDDIINKTHDEFNKERCIIIRGEIDDKIIEGASLQIFKWNEEDYYAEKDLKELGVVKQLPRSPIRIFIHSPGGLVMSSLALISSITTSVTPVHTYAMGFAGSAAFMIFIAGHKRFIQPYSILMYHDMHGGCEGKTTERHEAIHEVENFVSIYQSIVLKQTKITQKLLDKIHKEKLDYYFYAPDCLGKYKIAHEVY